MAPTVLPGGQRPTSIESSSPLIGVVIGVAISLVLWALIAALVLAVA